MGLLSGLWSGGCRLLKSVGNGVKKFASTVYDMFEPVVTTAASAIKAGVKAVAGGAKAFYDNVTGNKAKRISEEARKIYDEGRRKYEEGEAKYQREMEALNTHICNILAKINQQKQYIVEVLFAKLQKILAKIKYNNTFTREYLQGTGNMITSIQLRTDVLKIDFQKNPIKSRLKAIISFGLWANKQAWESLDEAKNEVKKMEDTLARMEAEISRYRLMKKVLERYLEYIEKMKLLYERLLFRANNAATFLRFKCIQFTHGLKAEDCRLESLPKADQDLMFALFNGSRILNIMVKKQLVDNSSVYDMQKHEREIISAYQNFDRCAA